MVKQAPTAGRMLVMILFALSCFAILTYLWQTFGGPVPIKAKGYQFSADFEEATTLADNADVRISGVSVGKVVKSRPGPRNRTRVTIQVNTQRAPVPKDTRATLRQKTLLGETYVELSPGDRRGGTLPDGGQLTQTNVRPTVELDEILRGFDPRTRRDLQRFLEGTAAALKGRGTDFSDLLGNAAPFAEDANDLLQLLDRQRGAIKRLVSDSATVFGSLGRRQGELEGLVRSADTVLSTTAARNAELTETVRILPTTLRELRPTLAEIEVVSRKAGPLFRDLRPAGRALYPALRDTLPAAPELLGLFEDLDRVIDVSKTAVPATTKTVKNAHEVFKVLDPTLREAVPVIDYLGLYKEEITHVFSNAASATQGKTPTGAGRRDVHYLRAIAPFLPEGLIVFDQRAGSNRRNPYLLPGGLNKLASGLEAIDCSNTGGLPLAPAPPCKLQQKLEFQGKRLSYPHLEADPK